MDPKHRCKRSEFQKYKEAALDYAFLLKSVGRLPFERADVREQQILLSGNVFGGHQI